MADSLMLKLAKIKVVAVVVKSEDVAVKGQERTNRGIEVTLRDRLEEDVQNLPVADQDAPEESKNEMTC